MDCLGVEDVEQNQSSLHNTRTRACRYTCGCTHADTQTDGHRQVYTYVYSYIQTRLYMQGLKKCLSAAVDPSQRDYF